MCVSACAQLGLASAQPSMTRGTAACAAFVRVQRIRISAFPSPFTLSFALCFFLLNSRWP